MRRHIPATLVALLSVIVFIGCDDSSGDTADVGAMDGAPEGCDVGETRACAVAGQCMGTQVCAGGAFGACAGAEEACDGADNDCDGTSDEGFGVGDACEAGEAACRVSGAMVCAADGMGVVCDATPGDATDEVCDGIDNDCNGEVDDGLDDGAPCETGELGVCADGISRCVDGVPACAAAVEASAEVCDGLDNDCDGESDEGEGGEALVEVCYSGPEGTEGVGACAPGTRRCVDGMPGLCMGQRTPIEEICDAIDSDCDGIIDEGFEVGGVCTVGVGACAAEGIQACDPGNGGVACDAVAGLPGAELCDAIDNDCDGIVDEVAGAGDACAVGDGACARDGALVCGDDGLVCDAVEGIPGEEACNLIDDDCDGTVDEVAGVGDACEAGVGACRVQGAQRCDVEGGALACDAVPTRPGPVEYCADGIDDDCDGISDEAPCSVACDDDADCDGGGSCIAGICGDPEICDDGQDNDADGAADCADDDCAGAEGCGPCGNGGFDVGEGCDDGNRQDDDGCSADCQVEEGFVCAAPGIDVCPEGQPAETLALTPGENLPPIGGNGGDAFADTCPAGEAIIGFDYHIGNQWRFSNGVIFIQRSRAQCARLEVVDGASVLTPTGVTPDRGGVPDSGVPAGFTDEVRCPEGQVVSGFTAYGEQYISGVALLCSPIAFEGGEAVIGVPVELAPVGRLDAVLGTSTCPEGTVVGASAGRAGHIIDQFTMRCDTVVEACRLPSTCQVDRACRFAFDGPAFDPAFVTDGEQPWSIDANGIATSGPITHNQSSNLRLPVSTPAGGAVSFQRRVSSEGCCDPLRFRVDGVELDAWRGDIPWGEVAFDLAPGDHVLEWAYTKDGSVNTGEDRAQIDDVAISGAAGLCADPAAAR